MISVFSDNIIAEITPAGRAAISGIRISGKNAKEITERLFSTKITTPRHSYLIKSDLDEVLVVYYSAPNSYTGEDVCEIFCHGNPSIVNSIIDTVTLDKELRTRIARPGEFTKRAYINGKMDLVQAEAVVDVINSSNTAAVKYRNHVLGGGLSVVLDNIKNELLEISAFTELEIDFEEESAGILDKPKSISRLQGILNRINDILNSFSKIEMLSKDIRVLILGDANVGKSSIFNKLIEQERSIVHEHPGTTRDYIEADIFLNGLEVTLIDTAGFRNNTDCEIEKLGMERIKTLLENTTLIVEVTDDDKYDFKYKNAIRVRNKVDIKRPGGPKEDFIYTSVNDPDSIRLLRCLIESELRKNMGIQDERGERFLLTKRQKGYLVELSKMVSNSLNGIKNGHPIDAVSFMIRGSINIVNDLTGKSQVSDETLDELFSRFCIGK
jgi:tRNA modification GTPase